MRNSLDCQSNVLITFLWFKYLFYLQNQQTGYTSKTGLLLFPTSSTPVLSSYFTLKQLHNASGFFSLLPLSWNANFFPFVFACMYRLVYTCTFKMWYVVCGDIRKKLITDWFIMLSSFWIVHGVDECALHKTYFKDTMH